MLVITRKKQESIVVGHNITLTVVRIGGDRVAIGVTAPKEYSVHRKEARDLPRPWAPPAGCCPTEAAFLRSIQDCPGDQANWLVYADWLEERGDGRAEFLRLQAELTRAEAGDARRREVRARLAELWRAHGAVWQSSLPPALRGLLVTDGLLPPDNP